MSKHTPGPWFSKPTMLKAVFIGSESGPVATTSSSSNVSRDTNIANARLIAAAPDMLATLRVVSLLLEHPEAGDIDPDRVAALIADTIRAATEG